jgi:hypothetical protein
MGRVTPLTFSSYTPYISDTMFHIILALIALAALWQLAKVIFFTVLWLATQVLLGVLTLCGAIFAPTRAVSPPSNVIPFLPVRTRKRIIQR